MMGQTCCTLNWTAWVGYPSMDGWAGATYLWYLACPGGESLFIFIAFGRISLAFSNVLFNVIFLKW